MRELHTTKVHMCTLEYYTEIYSPAQMNRRDMLTYTVGSHSLTVLSLEAEATKCPDGENATDNMASCIVRTKLNTAGHDSLNGYTRKMQYFFG